ncbi:DUF669 domain-containing protein [Nicoliella lavandulae]|uniref:DUF669 domain-containing protein n=1 Tax=Nicoliella lavandulae TaxID=3082954 RepID=A0ABU8SNJ8_9LACO
MKMSFNPNEVKDYAGQNDFSPLPTGNYEVIVKSVGENTTRNGRKSMQLELVIRNDLDNVPGLAETNAKYHNRHVFLDLWTDKSDNQSYNVKDIQSLLYQAGFNQPELDFPLDFINFMTKKPLKAFIKKEKNDFNGKVTERNRVAPYNVTKTDFPNVQHQWSDVHASESQSTPDFKVNFNDSNSTDSFNGEQQAISDDDLPF